MAANLTPRTLPPGLNIHNTLFVLQRIAAISFNVHPCLLPVWYLALWWIHFWSLWAVKRSNAIAFMNFFCINKTLETNIHVFSVKNLHWKRSRTGIGSLFTPASRVAARPRLRPAPPIAAVTTTAQAQTRNVWRMTFLPPKCSLREKQRHCYQNISRLVVNKSYL